MNLNLLKALLLVLAAQVISYFQLQGQFIWKSFKDNPLLLALLGYPISLLLIAFTKHCSLAFDGATWPGRLIGFAVGAIVFALLSAICLKEPFSTKTSICIALAVTILCIQIFWK